MRPGAFLVRLSSARDGYTLMMHGRQGECLNFRLFCSPGGVRVSAPLVLVLVLFLVLLVLLVLLLVLATCR